MPKKINLKIWEIRWNRCLIWFFWYNKNTNRKRSIVKVKCLKCWEEKIILKEAFIKWYWCKSCAQKIITKKLSDFKRTHWLWQSRFYHLYYSIKWRCNWLNKLGKKYYQDRWILCEWETFEEFKNDMYDDYIKHVKQFGENNTTIDRINNNWNYCKENCRWVTIKEQKRNTRRNVFYDFNWITLCEKDICDTTNLTKSKVKKIYQRVYPTAGA